MYKSLFAGICLFALAACGSGTDQNVDGGTDPDPDAGPNGIPLVLNENLHGATYNAAAGTLTLNMVSLDAGPVNQLYTRNAGLDVGPYQAYTYQKDPLDRHFTALVAQSGDPAQSVRAGVVADGGQFNRYFPSAFYERDGGFTPPSDATGGSDSALSIINGVPFVGIISRDARALSGTAVVADLSTSYRFVTDAKRSAYLAGRFYTRQVSLSSAAKRDAPDAHNRDYSATTLELGLKYVFRVGKRGGLSTIRANLGKNWCASDPKSIFARLGYEHSFLMNPRTRLTFSGSYERQNYAASW